MKYLLLFLSLTATFGVVLAQNSFPAVTTETIHGETVNVPGAFEGSFVLIGVGTGKKAEDDLKTWQVPIYNKFIAKTGLMDGLYDVKVCFLPLFTGAMKMAKNQVVQKLQENNEKLVLDHVYVYSGEREPFIDFGIEDKKQPYFYLLNPKGEIVWKGVGAFKQSYFDRMEEILSQ
ncbi:hypothetical protein O3Q51_09155 [Cryomorphaceae bacterium 1068]|nr:hypothetical protein [Cryomorphaceae bacterium 1068]